MDMGLKFLSENYFPERLKKIMLADLAAPERTEEIRIKANDAVCVLKKSGLYFLGENGETTEYEKAAFWSLAFLPSLLDFYRRRTFHHLTFYPEFTERGKIDLLGCVEDFDVILTQHRVFCARQRAVGKKLDSLQSRGALKKPCSFGQVANTVVYSFYERNTRGKRLSGSDDFVKIFEYQRVVDARVKLVLFGIGVLYIEKQIINTLDYLFKNLSL